MAAKRELVKPQLPMDRITNQVLRLKLMGASVDEIAETIGVPKSAVTSAIDEALANATTENEALAAYEVALECMRLDKMLAVAWDISQSEHREPEVRLKAVDTVLRVVERRAKKLGTDRVAGQTTTQKDGYTITIAPVETP